MQTLLLVFFHRRQQLTMKLRNVRLRVRLEEVEGMLIQIVDEIHRLFKNSSSTQNRVYRLQKERQRRLTEERTRLQAYLNHIIYPILSIPAELTSEIFLHCLADKPIVPSASRAPMLLGMVCRQWRSIAHGDPRLWTSLNLGRWDGPGVDLLVREWLARARRMPLFLNVVLPESWVRCYC